MMKRASLLICVLPLALGGCGGVRNWFAGTPMSDQPMQQAQSLSPQDRDLKVAMDVVQARLREADATGNYASLRPVQPQIYKLANALLPHAAQPQTVQPQPAHHAMQQTAPAQQAAMMPQAGAVQYPAHQTTQQPAHQPAQQPAPARMAVLMPEAHAAQPTQAHVAQPAQHQPFPGAAVQPAAMHKPEAQLAGAYAPPPVLSNSRSLYHAVQLGAYRSPERAMVGWHELQALAHGQLAGLQTRTERIDLGSKGVFYRLKAGPFPSRADAAARCHALASSGIACIGTDFTGTPS